MSESMDGNNLFDDNDILRMFLWLNHAAQEKQRWVLHGHFTSLQYRICDAADSRVHSTTL